MMYLRKIKFRDIFITFVFILLSFIGLYVYKKMNVNPIDFDGNRIICGYVLHGINPLKHIGEPALIDYLGVVPVAFGNLPYGLLLGNLFYFGFLGFDNAILAFRIESVLLVILTIVIATRYFLKCDRDKYLLYYFVLFTVLSLHIICSYTVGNAGHIVCMLIIISIFLSDENFVLSGLALSLAMIKPQIAFPFCITFLYLKKYKVVFFAAFVDVIALLICSFMVNENVLDMFRYFFNANVGSGATTYGLFTIFYKSNYYAALFPSMIAGIIILVISHIFTRRVKSGLIPFAFPALVANFWSYSWSSDYYILIIPAVVYLYLMFTIDTTSKNNWFLNVLLVLYCFVSLFLVAIKNVLRGYNYLSEIFKFIYQGKSHIERVVISNTISYVIIIIGIVLCVICIKIMDTSKIGDKR